MQALTEIPSHERMMYAVFNVEPHSSRLCFAHGNASSAKSYQSTDGFMGCFELVCMYTGVYGCTYIFFFLLSLRA